MMKENYLLFSDLKNIFRKRRKEILRIAIYGGLIALSLALIREPVYRVESLFKESKQSHPSSHQFGAITALLGNSIAQKEESNATAIMKSRFLLGKLAEDMGFQVQTQPKGKIKKILTRISENLLAEQKIPLKLIQNFRFRKVQYTGRKPTTFDLTMLSSSEFKVETPTGEVCYGTLNKKFRCADVGFTLTYVPKDVQIGKCYSMTLLPKLVAIETLQKLIRAETMKKHPSLIQLTCYHRDVVLGKELLNCLMSLYKEYLVEENEQVSQAQIYYLEKRQKQLFEKMERDLDQYALYLKEMIHQKGQFGVAQELQHTLSQQKQLEERFQGIDLERERLESSEGGSFLLKQSPITDEMLQLSKERHHLQKNLGAFDKPFSRNSLEFEGLNLEMTERLYLDYCKELDVVQIKQDQYRNFASEIANSNKELSSLSGLLQDEVSQKIIREAALCYQQLRDESHLSQKDQSRLQSQIERHRSSLQAHLIQMSEVEAKRERLLREKLQALQSKKQSLMVEEIELIDRQMRSIQEEYREDLSIERNALLSKLDAIKAEMLSMPDKWLKEKTLKLHNDLNRSLLKGMAELFESKNIEHHLSLVESKPFDRAEAAIHPRKPYLILLTFLGAFFSALSVFGYFLGRALSRGMPLTYERLYEEKKRAIGRYGERFDKEITRELNLGLKGKFVGFINGNGPDLSRNLAKILFKEGKRVLIVDLYFHGIIFKHELPGLIHVLEDRTRVLPTRSEKHYDFIPFGGVTRFGVEFLKKPSFRLVMEEMEKRYDHILFTTRAMPISMEAKILMDLVDTLMLNLDEESTRDLQDYFSWEDDRSRLNFVCY